MDTVDKVAERLARLELTVATGFHDNELRFQRIEAQLTASESRLSRKIDASTETLRGELHAVLKTLCAEHAADRELIVQVLDQHSRRLNDLEQA